MRDITREAVSAFVDGRNFKKTNSQVVVRNGEVFLYLHNNMIAHKHAGGLYVTHCGWRTNTTKERLNGILRAFKQPLISQKNFVWYQDGSEFNNKNIEL